MSDNGGVASGARRVSSRVAERPAFVHALALELDPAWRRLPAARRRGFARVFVDALAEDGCVRTRVYTMVGLRPGADLLLWSLGPAPDDLEERAAVALRTGLGAWAAVRRSLLGFVAGSPYRRRSTPALFAAAPARYLVVYPFTKSTEWHQLGHETRQGIMEEHIRIGRRYPQVRQLLANGFGLGDQDYLVAYETDDVAAFGDLVRELRGTEARRATVCDTPVLTAVRRPPEELVGLVAA